MLLRRIIFFVTGLFIISIGVSLTIKANIGTGAWDALNVGLYNKFGLTVGTWVIIVGAIVILVNAALLKRIPDFLAIITIMIIGLFIDFFLIFVLKGWELNSFFIEFIVFLLGLLILSLGIAMYLQAKFPLSPLDNLMLAIRERFHVSVGLAKTIGELTGLVLAFIFNGPIGIGTILVTLLIGPFIQLFFPFFERLMNRKPTVKTVV